MLSTKNHTGGLEGTEDCADWKIYSSPGFSSWASESNRGAMTRSSPVPPTEISVSTIQSDKNVLISNGINSSSISPSGNFHGCSFNITLNINKWCDEISFIQQTLSCFLLNYVFQSTASLQIRVQLLLRDVFKFVWKLKSLRNAKSV